MNPFLLAALVAVTTFDFLTRVGGLPKFLKFAPEFVSVVVIVCVVVLGVRDRFRNVRASYWLVFGFMAVIMLCGALANGVNSGPVIAGLRSYLRAIPMFLLPAVYAFSERQIKSQLVLLGAICLIQFPIALHQRLTGLANYSTTGDMTTGTLLASGILSTFMMCAICVLTAAFLRKRISLKAYLVLFVLFLAPTTINETKVTVVLLPLGLLVTFLAGARPGARLKNIIVAACFMLVASAVFIPVYDHFIGYKNGPTLSEFFLESEHIERYMSKDAGVGAASIKEVGRVDAVMTPLREMTRTAPLAAFGLGIGNASLSSLGQQFNGEHSAKFAPFLKTAASGFILELGVLGLLGTLLLSYLVYRDSRALAARGEGVFGMLAVGWSGVTAVLLLATFYTTIDGSVAVSYLFWYFSGVVAAERIRASRRPS